MCNLKDEEGGDFFCKKFFVSEDAGKAAFDEAISVEKVKPGERIALYEAGESAWGEMICSRLLYNVEPDFYGDSEVHEADEEEVVLIENEPFEWEDEDDEDEELDDEPFDWEDEEFDPADEPIMI